MNEQKSGAQNGQNFPDNLIEPITDNTSQRAYNYYVITDIMYLQN